MTMNIASLIDHTLLKPDATADQIEQLCQEARACGFASVCVNPYRVSQVAMLLNGSPVKTCSVVGFPLGANLTATKVAEARALLQAGARELDMVLNIGALKSGDIATAQRDIAEVAAACHDAGVLCKVIFETCLLTDNEKTIACQLCIAAKADFVKTSTGLSTGGATVEDIALMSLLVKPHGLQVKASGGIRSLADLQKMVAAGATRIGTSAGVRIVQEAAGQTVTPTASAY